MRLLVGVTGFEPTTSPSRTVRATKLRHTPTHFNYKPGIMGVELYERKN